MNTKINCFDFNNKLVIKDDIFIFDDSEPSNCEAWKRLPCFFQDFIATKHVLLRDAVFALCKPLKIKPIFTSGFRSQAVNKACGGVADSLHLCGLAVDFIIATEFNTLISKDLYIKYLNAFKDYPDNMRILQDFVLLAEKTHFHFSFRRNY